MFKDLRVDSVYVLDLDDVSSSGAKCLVVKMRILGYGMDVLVMSTLIF